MSEDKNPKSHVSWCWKQKRGIKLEEPNDNLCNAYIKKAKSALNMLGSAIEKDEMEWVSEYIKNTQPLGAVGIFISCNT